MTCRRSRRSAPRRPRLLLGRAMRRTGPTLPPACIAFVISATAHEVIGDRTRRSNRCSAVPTSAPQSISRRCVEVGRQAPPGSTWRPAARCRRRRYLPVDARQSIEEVGNRRLDLARPPLADLVDDRIARGARASRRRPPTVSTCATISVGEPRVTGEREDEQSDDRERHGRQNTVVGASRTPSTGRRATTERGE